MPPERSSRPWLPVLLALGAMVLPAHSGEARMTDQKVKLPQRLMLAAEILHEIHLQTGLEYAYPPDSLPRQVDVTPFGGSATVDALLKKLAPQVRPHPGAVLLERPVDPQRLRALTAGLSSPDADARVRAAFELGSAMSTQGAEVLFTALGDRDERVRHHALRSLVRLHRGRGARFPRGRRSVFGIGGTRPAAALTGVLKSAVDRTSNIWIWAAQTS